jgi:predicted nucleotidyltransferase
MAEQTSQTQCQYDPVIQEFAAMLRQRLGSHLRHILLFGSRARGDAQDNSDYNMLVVVDHRTPELRAIILEVESQLMERYGALVATVLRSEAEWQQLQGFPLARNIAREGVPL